MTTPIRVLVWNENRHEQKNPKVAGLYPQGIHGAIAGFLNREPGLAARTATLDEPEHGLTDRALAETDVLVWWGHIAHKEVDDAVVDRVQARVLSGMGLIVLHSGHYAKIFKRMMGTTCSLTWREADDHERVWTVAPGHPIAAGLPASFVVPATEMYGEYFDIPQPDHLVFVSWYKGGEVFRSGCCFQRGLGKVFYFAPGHETYPIYHQSEVQRVIANAVRWAAPVAMPGFRDLATAPNVPVPPEPYAP
jgi:trehalose utilization protein